MDEAVGDDCLRDFGVVRKERLFQWRIHLATGFPVRRFPGIDRLEWQHLLCEVFEPDSGFDQPGRKGDDDRVKVFEVLLGFFGQAVFPIEVHAGLAVGKLFESGDR
ncbi:hypothetical protein D3C87_1288300 [compost metagenome]